MRTQLHCLIAVFVIGLSACGSSGNEGSSVAEPKYSLRKSGMTEMDLENEGLWNAYQRPTIPYAAGSPDEIGFSVDGRLYLNVILLRDGVNGTDECAFHMVSAVEFSDTAAGASRLSLIGTPEFIFSYGVLGWKDRHAEADSLNHKEQRPLAERLCFERFSKADLDQLFKRDDFYPRVNFYRVTQRSEQELVFGVLVPRKRTKDLPVHYRFVRVKKHSPTARRLKSQTANPSVAAQRSEHLPEPSR